MSQQDNIRNAILLGGSFSCGTGNSPTQYSSRQKQYFSSETACFLEKYGKYASDVVSANAQGLDQEDPLTWRPVTIRMADIVTPSATMTRMPDDYKKILVVDRRIDYIPPGAKFETLGSTWLCTAPENVSGAFATGMVEKCNTVWNHLDYYGNVRSEPMAVSNTLSRASSPDPQGLMLITKGYYNVKCQSNQDTQQLNDNSRVMLGSSVYCITGFSKDNQEFTTNEDSVRVLEFTLRYEEPNPTIDDLKRRIAGGKEFSWEISVTGIPVLAPGQKTVFSASSERCGEPVSGTGDYPITYQWSSTNSAVAEVDEATGEVTAVGEGTCQILCALAQNPQITTSYGVSVETSAAGTAVSFLTSPPQIMGAYEKTEIICACYQNGIEDASGTATWSFSGANETSYSAEITGNKAVVTCWKGDSIPLRVEAIWNGAKAETEISLHGL